jgi:hypothetical protein
MTIEPAELEEAQALDWDAIEQRHECTVSPQARRVLGALREKPALLVEVSIHLIDGWPTKDLVDPWEVVRFGTTFVLARFPHHTHEDDRSDPRHHGIAGVDALTGDGHEGDQWQATVIVRDPENHAHGKKAIKRIFNDPLSAGAWADARLRDDGKLVSSELTPELVAARHEEVDAAEREERERAEAEELARRRREDDDDIPF